MSSTAPRRLVRPAVVPMGRFLPVPPASLDSWWWLSLRLTGDWTLACAGEGDAVPAVSINSSMIKSWLVLVCRNVCGSAEGPVGGAAGEASGSDTVLAVTARLVLFRPVREVLEADIRPAHIGGTASKMHVP